MSGAVDSSPTKLRRLTGEDILCISSIDWDFIWQGHQEIMATLASQGNRVLFVENTGVRTPNLRDLPRLKHRLANWLRGTKGFREEQPNLYVYSPVLLPFPYAALARWVNRWLLLRALRRWMRAVGFHCPILWTFLPTPLVLDVIRDVEPRLTIYYCIDDFASSSKQAQKIVRSEERLFRQADLVFVTSRKLAERAKRFRERVELFPFGISFLKFERARRSADSLPGDLQALRRPVIGYVGGVHQWVDQDLLAHVASRMPEVSFALVGPPQTDVSRLAGCPNIHLLGQKPHTQVPYYIKGFDVGIVPYRLSEYTAHVYPTKLNEYLAMGVPVVATDLPEVRRFNDEHGAVVAVAGDATQFLEAVRAAIRPVSPELSARLTDVAKRNGWEERIGQMSALILQELDQRRSSGWQVSLRRLYRTARRRVVSLALVLVLVWVLLLHGPLIWWLAEPLRLSLPPQKADAIIVLAGGTGESGKAGGGYQERVKQAADLYHAGQASHMIFASGYTFVFQEAEMMKDLAVSCGIPASSILLEVQGINTRQSLERVEHMVRQQGWHSILLVSSPYHMRRAILVWQKLAPDVAVFPSPVPHSQFYIHERAANFEQIYGILHEYAGLFYYWWRGWL